MGSIVTNVQGNTGGDEATYTIADVAVGGSIQASKFTDIGTKVNQERARRGRLDRAEERGN